MPSGNYDGGGNIAQDPMFVNAANGDFRLHPNSPCINAGNNTYVVGTTDLDGDPRIYNGTVDMGCYEYQGSTPLSISPSSQSVGNGAGSFGVTVTATVSWSVTTNASWLSVSPTSGSGNGSFTVSYTANTVISPRSGTVTVTGDGITRTISVTQASASVTLNPNGGVVSPASASVTVGAAYGTLPTPTWAGYTFIGWFTAASGGTQVTTTMTVTQTTAHTLYAQWSSGVFTGDYYVNIARPDDSGDGQSWATAKQTIQAAIDIAVAGREIIVTNGIYAPISTANKAVTVHSVNGAEVTVIDGGGTNRCATLGSATSHTSTVLTGFTLRNGNASHANVTVSRNYGGGSCYGTLNTCILTNNTGPGSYGGGSYYGILNNCTFSGNTSWDGGGSYYGTLNNCTLAGNTASSSGGGSYYSTLNNCTLAGNTAASRGGGARLSTLNNCILTGNTANEGGGANDCTLNNCTLWGNKATTDGGSRDGTLNNCIVWGNSLSGSGTTTNYSGGTFRYSCTAPMPSGSQDGGGNIAQDPMFMGAANGDFRLWFESPCIDKGNNTYVVGTIDLDGNMRIYNGTVDMGAYEYQGTPGNRLTISPTSQSVGSKAGSFGVAVTADVVWSVTKDAVWITVSPESGLSNGSFTVSYTANTAASPRLGTVTVTGGEITRTISVTQAPALIVTFNPNGGAVSPASASVTFGGAYGTLPVPTRSGYAFIGWSTAAHGGMLVTAATTVTQATAHTLYAQWIGPATSYYVDISRPDDSGDGQSWATAKKTLQAAIDIASIGSEIIVTNGVYAPILAVNKAISIRSVNGADVTVIDGGGTNRCATLGVSISHINTVLTGFTLMNGFAEDGMSGITYGGGALYGILNNCILTGNEATFGGGAFGSTLNNCTLTGNRGNATSIGYSFGGGAYGSTLRSCTVSGNTATYGGGVSSGTLGNCTLSGNTATYGGGVADGTLLYNCILAGNTANNAGGGAYEGVLNNCVLAGNTAHTGGGVYWGMLNNCIVWGNSATSGSHSNYANSTFFYSCTAPMPSGEEDGGGNIAQDPKLADAANGDFRLQENSPCIDAGNNAYVDWDIDFDGKPRILNGVVDMGAYEFGEMLPQSPEIPVAVPFDWLGDYRGWKGITGYADLALSQGENGLFFWESYVAGLNPTDATSKFSITNVTVKSNGGKDAAPTILLDWTPHRTDRKYTVMGKTNLTDSAWHSPTNDATRFFKVEVKMPKNLNVPNL